MICLYLITMLYCEYNYFRGNINDLCCIFLKLNLRWLIPNYIGPITVSLASYFKLDTVIFT